MKTIKTASYKKKIAQFPDSKGPMQKWVNEVNKAVRNWKIDNGPMYGDITQAIAQGDESNPNIWLTYAIGGTPYKYWDLSQYYPDNQQEAIQQVISEIQQLQQDPEFVERAKGVEEDIQRHRKSNDPNNPFWTGD